MAEAQADGFIAIGIMIAVARVRLVGTVYTGGVIEAGAKVEAGLLVATGQAETAFPGLVIAQTDMQAWLQALLVAAPGEDLNHPANRIAAVNH